MDALILRIILFKNLFKKKYKVFVLYTIYTC